MLQILSIIVVFYAFGVLYQFNWISRESWPCSEVPGLTKRQAYVCLVWLWPLAAVVVMLAYLYASLAGLLILAKQKILRT